MRRAASRAAWTAGRSSPTRMAMTEITTSSSMREKPLRPHHRHRYPDMAHLPKHGAILVQKQTDHAITGGLEPVPGPLHQAIDFSNPGIIKIEVVTGGFRSKSAGGTCQSSIRL